MYVILFNDDVCQIANETSLEATPLSSDHMLFLGIMFCFLRLWYIFCFISRTFLGLHVAGNVPSACVSSCLCSMVWELYSGWWLRYPYSNGASCVFISILLTVHLGGAMCVFFSNLVLIVYDPHTWFSGTLLCFFSMETALVSCVLPKRQLLLLPASLGNQVFYHLGEPRSEIPSRFCMQRS